MKTCKTTTAPYAANNNTAANMTSVENEVNRISAIAYDSFIKDHDALCVALYASHPFASSKLLRLPKGDSRRRAAETAKALHCKPARARRLAAGGYFEAQLRVLLEIAGKNPDHGAKLAQVFVYMLVHQQEHLLSEAIVAELKEFLGMRDFQDGFIIIAEKDDEYVVMTAL